jgi:hypothetical protein
MYLAYPTLHPSSLEKHIYHTSPSHTTSHASETTAQIVHHKAQPKQEKPPNKWAAESSKNKGEPVL